MITEIKIPAVGESVTEATIAEWAKKSGDVVKRDDVLLVLETDKASVEVVAENAGQLTTKIDEGETVDVGTVVGQIDSSVTAGPATTSPSAAAPTVAATSTSAAQAPSPPPIENGSAPTLTPAAQKMATENNLDLSQIRGTGRGGQILKEDLAGAPSLTANTPQSLAAATPATSAPVTASPVAAQQPPAANVPLPVARGAGQDGPTTTREPMSRLRQTIAKRLVEAQATAAILTTFNEIDMSQVMDLRKKYKESFKKKHEVGLGFMGFFVKASIEALKSFPRVNAFIDDKDVILNHFQNIGIAVGTPKGLVVPVIRDADHLSLAEVELSIRHYALKARDGKIAMDDLAGGTFTISNGGTYGSMMSTPILNPPQSAILGLHKIEDRPVVIDGKIEVRPMMYVALSYDHRIIDGAESVQFLVKIKECIEDPSRILLNI